METQLPLQNKDELVVCLNILFKHETIRESFRISVQNIPNQSSDNMQNSTTASILFLLFLNLKKC